MGSLGTRLIFIYNADSSLVSQALGFAHKMASPETYSCNLCRVTYGTFTAKKEWTEFIEGLPYKSEFLHKDEFQGRYPATASMAFPSIFLISSCGELRLLADAEELSRPRTVDGMKDLIRSKLQANSQ